SISRRRRAWKGRMRARTSSGSCCSEAAVKPTRSQKSTETTLRSSRAGAEGRSTSAAPQFRQNFARSGFSSPHWGQADTNRVEATRCVRQGPGSGAAPNPFARTKGRTQAGYTVLRKDIRGRPGFDVVGSPAELQADVPGRPRKT